MNEYEDFLAGYSRIINAAGTLTRLGGTLMRPETVRAMADASGHFFDIAELQTWAGEVIAGVTGAEAGQVTSGAAAALTLAAASCIAGLDPQTMEELPFPSTLIPRGQKPSSVDYWISVHDRRV